MNAGPKNIRKTQISMLLIWTLIANPLKKAPINSLNRCANLCITGSYLLLVCRDQLISENV
jgi:hypothetical protein